MHPLLILQLGGRSPLGLLPYSWWSGYRPRGLELGRPTVRSEADQSCCGTSNGSATTWEEKFPKPPAQEPKR